jgi:hypothetical protein
MQAEIYTVVYYHLARNCVFHRLFSGHSLGRVVYKPDKYLAGARLALFRERTSPCPFENSSPVDVKHHPVKHRQLTQVNMLKERLEGIAEAASQLGIALQVHLIMLEGLSGTLRWFVYALVLAHLIALGVWVCMLRKGWRTTEEKLLSADKGKKLA